MLPSANRVPLLLLCSASFIAVVDATIVTIALPTIRDGMELSAPDAQWVMNAYALAFGGFLLLFGRIADIAGRRRAFEIGLVVFAIGSLVAGCAIGPVMLLAGRALQGLGAALFVPASLSLLTTTFSDPNDRGRAVGIYGGMAALGFVVGMVGGGVITDLWGWRWVFLVNLPVAVLIVAPSHRWLSESRDRSTSQSPDVVGAVTVTGGVAALIYAVTAAPQHGWTSVQVVLAGAAGLALLGLFAVVELRHPSPLVPPDVVRIPTVLASNAAIGLQSMVGIGWLYVLTLYFQEVRGHGPLEAGLLFAPMTVSAVLAAPVAGRIVTGLGIRRTAAAGLTTLGTGIAVMIAGLGSAGPPVMVVAGMVLGEAGFMFSNVALTVAGTTAVPVDRSGLAAGLLNTSTQLGGGTGLGIVAASVAAASPPAASNPGVDSQALRWGLATCLAFVLLAFTTLRALPDSGAHETAPSRHWEADAEGEC